MERNLRDSRSAAPGERAELRNNPTHYPVTSSPTVVPALLFDATTGQRIYPVRARLTENKNFKSRAKPSKDVTVRPNIGNYASSLPFRLANHPGTANIASTQSSLLQRRNKPALTVETRALKNRGPRQLPARHHGNNHHDDRERLILRKPVPVYKPQTPSPNAIVFGPDPWKPFDAPNPLLDPADLSKVRLKSPDFTQPYPIEFCQSLSTPMFNDDVDWYGKTKPGFHGALAEDLISPNTYIPARYPTPTVPKANVKISTLAGGSDDFARLRRTAVDLPRGMNDNNRERVENPPSQAPKVSTSRTGDLASPRSRTYNAETNGHHILRRAADRTLHITSGDLTSPRLRDHSQFQPPSEISPASPVQSPHLPSPNRKNGYAQMCLRPIEPINLNPPTTTTNPFLYPVRLVPLAAPRHQKTTKLANLARTLSIRGQPKAPDTPVEHKLLPSEHIERHKARQANGSVTCISTPTHETPAQPTNPSPSPNPNDPPSSAKSRLSFRAPLFNLGRSRSRSRSRKIRGPNLNLTTTHDSDQDATSSSSEWTFKCVGLSQEEGRALNVFEGEEEAEDPTDKARADHDRECPLKWQVCPLHWLHGRPESERPPPGFF